MLSILLVLSSILLSCFLWEWSWWSQNFFSISSTTVIYTTLSLVAVFYAIRSKNLNINLNINNKKNVGIFLALFSCVLIIVPLISSLYSGSRVTGIGHFSPSTLLTTVLLIPVMEEYIFRKQLTTFYKSKLKARALGAYLSVFIFSFLHTQPSLQDLYTLNIGLAVGPFLLGGVCEILVFFSKSIIPAIIFHCICNASSYVFTMLDSRWLNWLKVLYSHGQ